MPKSHTVANAKGVPEDNEDDVMIIFFDKI